MDHQNETKLYKTLVYMYFNLLAAQLGVISDMNKTSSHEMQKEETDDRLVPDIEINTPSHQGPENGDHEHVVKHARFAPSWPFRNRFECLESWAPAHLSGPDARIVKSNRKALEFNGRTTYRQDLARELAEVNHQEI